MPEKQDKYQKRYVAHQERKKQVLIEIMKARHSERMFSDQLVDESIIKELIDCTKLCPSSCDRHGVYTIIVTDRDEKALLGGILVGGVGWIHRAPAILLIMADPVAYKAGDEIKFMPYLDAGALISPLYLTATANKLACCFVNPNIRPMNQKHFAEVFGNGMFCGAFAVGHKYEKN